MAMQRIIMTKVIDWIHIIWNLAVYDNNLIANASQNLLLNPYGHTNQRKHLLHQMIPSELSKKNWNVIVLLKSKPFFKILSQDRFKFTMNWSQFHDLVVLQHIKMMNFTNFCLSDTTNSKNPFKKLCVYTLIVWSL